MSAKRVLIAILIIAFIIECLYPLGGFLAPDKMLELFRVGVTPDTRFLTFILTWCLLFVAIVCGLTLRLVQKGDPAGWTLSYVLGLWWIGIGLGLCLVYGRIDNLFLDALKGLIITVAAWQSRPRSP